MGDAHPFSFISYTHPDQQAHRSNRRKALRHVGIHFRNRSRPAARRAAEKRLCGARRSVAKGSASGDDGDSRSEAPVVLAPPLWRDGLAYREDPFAVYPVERSPAIAPALDYFITYYGSSHMVRPQFLTTDEGDLLVREYFQYAFQKPVLFESIVALARANSMINQWADRRADSLSLYHYGQAISKVGQALSDPRDCMDDAVIFAVMSLIGINYLLNDLGAFRVNLMGLRRLIALRGGLDAIGWPMLVKPTIQGLEAFWTYIKHQPHLVGSYDTVVPGCIIDEGEPMGPPAAVDGTALDEELASRLPVGFRVLAEQHRISPLLAKVIDNVTEFDLTLDHGPPTPYVHQSGILKFTNFKTRDGQPLTVASNLQACEQLAGLLARSDLPTIERICCIGLFFILLCCTRSEQLSPLYLTQLQHHAGELLDMPLNDQDPAALHLLAWANLNVASTMVPPELGALPNHHRSDVRFALLAKSYDFFSKTHGWDDMAVIMNRFISNDACMAAWKAAWYLGERHHGTGEDAG